MRTIRIWVLGLMMCLPAAACSQDGAGTGDQGGAELFATVASRLTAADVTSVVVTISGAGIATPIVTPLVKSGGQWQGTIGKIPAGTDRTFHGDARDANGQLLYTGERTGVTITKNQIALLTLLLQQATPPTPFANAVPRIDSLLASQAEVSPGDVVSLGVTAHDPDPGDVLTYAWTVTGGTFADTTAPQTSWTAPAAEGSYTLTISVHDPKNALAAMSVQIHVANANARGSASINATMNTWPNVEGLTGTSLPLDVGQTTQLSLVASDDDGDPLTFAWSASCGGTFSDPSVQDPSFTLSALPPSGSCTLSVVVSDGKGGSNSGELSIPTGPGALVNLAPVIDSTFQSTLTADPGTNVVLSVGAHDPEGGPVSFAWSTNAGTLGTPASTAATSEVVWTAPTCGVATALATVTDASGAVATTSYSITGPACATSCKQIHDASTAAPDGVYTVTGDGGAPILVLCLMSVDGGGWTLAGNFPWSGNTNGVPGWTSGDQIGTSFTDTTHPFKFSDTLINAMKTTGYRGHGTATQCVTGPCAVDDTFYWSAACEYQSNGSGPGCGAAYLDVAMTLLSPSGDDGTQCGGHWGLVSSRCGGPAAFGTSHVGDHVFVGELDSFAHAYDGRPGEDPSLQFWVK